MKSVLHVLPHPGGGGETYVDSLDRMEDYAFERFYLARSSAPRDALRSLVRTALEVQFEARNHDLIHVEGEIASAVCLPSLALRPSVVTLNGLHLLRRVDGSREKAARANLRLMLAAASRVICVSDSEHDDFLRAVGRDDHERAVLIRNGVRPLAPPSAEERDAARAAFGLPPGVIVAAWLAGLDDHKDPLTAANAAIEVARRGTSFALLMAGDGPLRPELEHMAAERDTNSLRILGFRTDVRQVLAAADFFVLTSRREGLSFSLLEAMSMGLPAVVSDGPGNPDAVGDTGLVVAFGDIEGFADAFARLAADSAARLQLAELARKRVLENFSVDDMVRRTRDVYEATLRDRDRR